MGGETALKYSLMSNCQRWLCNVHMKLDLSYLHLKENYTYYYLSHNYGLCIYQKKSVTHAEFHPETSIII